MGTQSTMVDLASHFPPSKYIGRAADTTSGTRMKGGASHFDGVVLFPHGTEILAYWRPRMVCQRRIGMDKTKYSSQCEVVGFAKIKGALRAQVTEPVFLQTMRDGNAGLDTVFRMFNKERAFFNCRFDSGHRRGLSMTTETTVPPPRSVLPVYTQTGYDPRCTWQCRWILLIALCPRGLAF
jgi:hypothetical protein